MLGAKGVLLLHAVHAHTLCCLGKRAEHTRTPPPPPPNSIPSKTQQLAPRPAPQRGKDGHLTLNTSGDFFSNPMGGGGGSTGASPKAGGYGGGYGGRGGGYGGGSGSGAGGRREEAGGSQDAQQRFGNAKSISSAAYFGKDDREAEAERQGRLSQFQVGVVVCVCVLWAGGVWAGELVGKGVRL